MDTHEALLVHLNMLTRQLAGISVCAFDYIRAPLLNRPTAPMLYTPRLSLADLFFMSDVL